MADPSRPLVTFHIIAYNHARFIRAAVESALAQTYTPLEILLSDDCSTDGTFEIMKEAVCGYTGPHTVILQQNSSNLGVSEHTNRIMQRASGELVVAADGDDISAPRRVERCVEEWLRNGKPAALVSPVFCIDAAGSPSPTRDGGRWFAQFLPYENETREDCLRRFCETGSPRLVSCSAAWTKKMFEAFGPLPPDVWFEDDVVTLRAWLFGRIVFMAEVLVHYREHDSNIFNRVIAPGTTWTTRKQAEAATATEARRRRISLLAFLPDLERAVQQQWIAERLYRELRRQVEARCAFLKIIEDWWNVGWPMRIASILVVARSGRAGELRWFAARLLPFPLFLTLGALWGRARQVRQAMPAVSPPDHRLRNRQPTN